MREKRLCGGADEVSTAAVQVWTERLPELWQDYVPRNILNLDKPGLFLIALPEKGFMEKGKKTKASKKSVMTVIFIVASDGSFVFEPSVIWRSKGRRCFKFLIDPVRPMSVHYISNKKPWMDSNNMESILTRLDQL